jgi:DNA-binding MarR family transcriptional regulator
VAVARSADPAWALANGAWEALLRAHTGLLRRFAAAPVWGELSMGDYDVLYTLAKAGGTAPVGALERGVLLSQPGLSRLVDRLVARGWLAKAPNPADGRSVLVSLTAEGRAAQRRAGRAHGDHVAQVVRERLTAEEQAALRGLCAKLAGDGPAAQAE